MFLGTVMIHLFLVLFLALGSHAHTKAILLVGNPESTAVATLEAALKKLKYSPVVISNRDSALARVSADYLESVVIRVQQVSDPKSLMNLNESDVWVDYLAQRGSMVFFGDGMNLAEIPEGFFGALGFTLESKQVPAGQALGVFSDLVSHDLTLQVPASTGPVMVPVMPKSQDTIMRYSDGTPLAIKHQSCAFRLVYWSVTPGIVSDSDLVNVLSRSLDWCLGQALMVNNPAPDFHALNISGEPVPFLQHLNASSGKIRIVEFMASWCSSCAKQLPHMLEVRRSFSAADLGLHFVSYMETPETVQGYLSQHPDISWPVVITANGLGAQRYGVKALPAVFILDSRGVVRHIFKKVTPAAVIIEAVHQTMKMERFGSLHDPVLDSGHANSSL